MQETRPDKATVLIVDDQTINIQTLAAILGNSVRSVFALNGEHALQRVRESPVDLILLDVMLPGIDGFSVCEQLQSDPTTATIPVIFVSGLTEGSDEERGFAVGAVDYIHKPFLPAIVKARVRTHLKLRAALAELNRLARTDQLTGIANRRAFDRWLEQACRQSSKDGTPLTLLLIDIDHFKLVNDRYGHGTGDRVLVDVAQRMQAMLSEGDFLARWGGEEFVVLCQRDAAAGMLLGESLRQAVSHGDTAGGQITISIGVAAYTPALDVKRWLQLADHALYAAKAAGRNCAKLAASV